MKNLWEAEVIDNNDPDKAGRVKIKIPTLHARILDKDNLPWAKQKSLFSGGSDSYGSSTIPEIGSLVWVQFDNDKDYLKPFYVADIHLNNFHPHSLFEDNVKSSVDGFSSNYPDVKYQYYRNGVCIGVSSSDSTPEIVIYHPKGAYSYIDANGKILNVSPVGIENKSGSAATEPTVLGTQIKTALENILDALASLTVTCTSSGNPSSVPINAPVFAAIKLNLATILSTLNKNN